MSKIKQIPEDFFVEEIPLEILQKEGLYQVYWLDKLNYTTERAVNQIAKSLGIVRKNISYSGTKDKQAHTKQLISIKGSAKKKIEDLELKDIKLSFAGYSKEPLVLGGLKGNKFRIVVRDVEEVVSAKNNFFIPNYFDSQRFSNNNLEVGRAILKKDYKKAVEEIIKFDKDYSMIIKNHLDKSTNDYVGALKCIPRRSLLFYVHSIQSWIFNQLLSSEIKKGKHFVIQTDFGDLAFPINPLSEGINGEFDLVGFDSDSELLLEYGLNPNLFLNRQFPELSLEGNKRKKYAEVKDCTISNLEEDELNIGKKKYVISFSLPKGSYATIVLKHLSATQ